MKRTQFLHDALGGRPVSEQNRKLLEDKLEKELKDQGAAVLSLINKNTYYVLLMEQQE